MTYKLVYKNVIKSIRDYGVYFFTLVLGVCIFYLFNAIYAQEEMMSFSHSMHSALRSLRQVINYVSVFVAVVLGFLIVYANNYIIKRRKKELGIYMLLGMDKRDISNILLWETSIVAVVALIIGLLLGIELSQFMSLVTAKIFEANLTRFKFIVAPDAIVKAVLYFGIIFLVVILFNVLTLQRYQLIHLINGSKSNEKLSLKSPRKALAIFIMALICLSTAYKLIIENGLFDLTPTFYTSIALGTVGTVLFFFSLTGFGILMVQRKKRYYFQSLNMFVMRQLNNKVNTNFLTMSVVCLVLLLTIGILSCGLSIQNVISGELKESAPYDVSVELSKNYYTADLAHEGQLRLMSNANVAEGNLLTLYRHENLFFRDLLPETTTVNPHFLDMPITFIGLGDINSAMVLQGKKPLILEPGHYGIIANMKYVLDISHVILETQESLTMDGRTLAPPDQVYEMATSNITDTVFILVEQDALASLTADTQIVNLNYKETDEAHALAMQTFFDGMMSDTQTAPALVMGYASKYDLYTSSVTGKAIISFLSIYLGFVFLIASASILALQQLSEAIDNKVRYDMLKKLGADRYMIRGALFKQIALYFLLPLILAIVHSVIGLYVANQAISKFGEMDVFYNSMLTATAVIVVYCIYFALTYIGSKNYIEQA